MGAGLKLAELGMERTRFVLNAPLSITPREEAAKFHPASQRAEMA